MGRLETLAPGPNDEVLAYLARRPYDNVYVAWLIATGRAVRGDVLVWRDAADAVAGACYRGPQVVLCTDDDAAIDAFAARARETGPPRMIVGPRRAVERFRTRTRGRLPPPRAVRTSQPVYALAPSALAATPEVAALDVARASRDELDELVPHAAQMISGELGGDPTRAGNEFRNRTARIIDARWYWRYRVDGRLAFMCNVGSATPQTAQLQGVWAPPAMRGAGHATRGLAAICRCLFDEFATLSLYVNDFNAPAIALYERIGFTRVGEFQTLLFD